MAALYLKRNIKLFVLPLDSRESDDCVEQADLAYTEGFHLVTDSSFDIPHLTEKLLNWERLHNTFRPHRCLDYLSP